MPPQAVMAFWLLIILAVFLGFLDVYVEEAKDEEADDEEDGYEDA